MMWTPRLERYLAATRKRNSSPKIRASVSSSCRGGEVMLQVVHVKVRKKVEACGWGVTKHFSGEETLMW